MKKITLPLLDGRRIWIDDSGLSSNLKEGASKSDEDLEFCAAIDGIESLVLACYKNGIDITDRKFLDSIITAIEAADNNT